MNKTIFIFRTYKSYVRLQGNPARGIIDGDLIWKYLNLPFNEKSEVAKKIGTRISEIVEDIEEINWQTAHFWNFHVLHRNEYENLEKYIH